MTTATPLHQSPARAAASFTLEQFVQELGGIALRRIRMTPAPGMAKLADLIENNEQFVSPLCELVAGALIEKAPTSYLENRLAFILAYYLQAYLRQSPVGAGFTEGAMYRLNSGNVRLPDLSVSLRSRFPDGKVQRVPYANFAPDLAIEILSQSNTVAEIALKREELFASGTQVMWVIDPGQRVVDVFTAPTVAQRLQVVDELNGGAILPGFTLSIQQLFSEAEEV